MNRGKYIVIEGAEGVGKTTMVQMLAYQLQAAQLPVKVMREPDSQNDLTARALRRLLLDPRFPMTTRTEVLLFNAARVQSLEVIRNAVENGVTCLVDRSYLTTLANQYYGRGDITDYAKINEIIDFAVGDMQPDLMMVLDAPVRVLRDRVQKRATNHGRFAELDDSFYERVRAGYLWEAKQRNLPVVYATDDIDTVFKQVWQHVTRTLAIRDGSKSSSPQSVAEVLAARPATKIAQAEPPIATDIRYSTDSPAEPETPSQTPTDTLPAAQEADEPWTQKQPNGSVAITPAGKAAIADFVTSTESSVYSFTDKISPITVAAAMARLSRRGDDMRVTLLDEFIGKTEKDEQLLRRVITAYGDDSVQQLAGQHVVVENASNLVAKKLEWGRLAAYLEQSTRYIYFDAKDVHGHYKFYIPQELHGKLRSQYIRTMNRIFDLYSTMVQQMTAYVRQNSDTPEAERDGAWRSATKAQACDAIRGVLPVAYTGTVGIYASGQALESLIMHLLSDELPEARRVGEEMLVQLRKVMPVFLERADKPDRGGAMIAYRATTYAAVKALADKLLPAQHTAPGEAVTLVNHTMSNELDIVADMLYEHTDLPLTDLKQIVASWSYDQKLDVFKTYMGERLNRRHRPGRALEKIHYSFDLVTDYGVFKALQRHRMVDDLEWQELSPRLGYDMPQFVEDAGLVEPFEECFALSLELYSALQADEGHLMAQYAVLQGSNLRWKLTINARQAFQMLELRTGPQGHSAYRRVAQTMYQRIAEIHPMLAEAMIFVNQGEDPALARLAAERYTQYKLSLLENTSESTAQETPKTPPKH
ncbi:MAG TPA: dTMP kinase [Candidatus Saccharimonadales bacterium]|nr:dTMP kinase [Candidatus Saccharimonadales bacterium]